MMPSRHSKRKWRRHRRKRSRKRMIPADVVNDTSRRRKGEFAGLIPVTRLKRYHHMSKDIYDLSLRDKFGD